MMMMTEIMHFNLTLSLPINGLKVTSIIFLFTIFFVFCFPYLWKLTTACFLCYFCFSERLQILTQLLQLQVLDRFYELRVLFIQVLAIVPRVTRTQMENLRFYQVMRKVQCKILPEKCLLVMVAAYLKQFSMVYVILFDMRIV